MKPDSKQAIGSRSTPRRGTVLIFVFATACLCALTNLQGAESKNEPAWRSLPLISGNKVDPDWVQVGWGGFIVEEGVLRTDPAAKGLGLIVYKKEKLGNCQIRIVFKAKEAKCNSGVYVRLADGILDQTNNPGAAFERDAAGKISKDSMEKMQASGEREEGPWYAVHHGYEVQIADTGDPSHGTGLRSLVAPMSKAAAACGADGLIVEVHPCPERALSDGPQSLDLPGFENLMKELGREPARDVRAA